MTEHWSPKVIARVSDQYMKVAKVKGELAWHAHDAEDGFWVVRGRLRLEWRHDPVAEEECWLVLIEPVTTQHKRAVEPRV